MSVNIWIWGVVTFPLVLLLWLHRVSLLSDFVWPSSAPANPQIYSSLLELLIWDRSLAALWARLHYAETFEQWEAAGLALDHRYRIDTWRKVDKSRAYAWELIGDRLAAFSLALQAGHVQALVHLLQSGLVRNLGNITAPALYNTSFAGTKYLIENYVLQVCEIIRDLVALPEDDQGASFPPVAAAADADSPPLSPEFARAVADGRCQLLSRAEKRRLFSNMRQSYGRTTLVLQGGSIFGACHLGVARALFRRGLLPRIITGSGTGALIAALLGTHTDAELPGVLDGTGIDLSAFEARRPAHGRHHADRDKYASVWWSPLTFRARWATLRRRLARFWHEGYFLDVRVLEQCVRDNGGNLTFEEAYRRTGRTLNITVVTGGGGSDVPSVLNYVTAPNVLIWTAAVASNATGSPSPSPPSSKTAAAPATATSNDPWYGRRQTAILCKDTADGDRILPWPLADAAQFRHWTYAGSVGGSGGGSCSGARATDDHHQQPPLQRVAQLFQVNHFVVSQARPYLLPFLEPSLHSPTMRGFALGSLARARAFALQQAGHLVRHRLNQLVRLGWLPQALRRLLLDEAVPGAGGGSSGNSVANGRLLVLLPNVPLRDYVRLLDAPSPDSLRYWIRRGEQAVWPAVAALKVRCSLELALEQACQDLTGPAGVGEEALTKKNTVGREDTSRESLRWSDISTADL